MLRLNHQVHGGQICGRGRIGNHDDLRGSSKGRGDADKSRKLTLGLGHVGVSWADDHINSLDGVSSYRHSGNRLGTSNCVDSRDPGHVSSCERRVVNTTISSRRSAQDDLPDSRHSSGSSTHQDRRRVARSASRGITASAFDRNIAMLHDEPLATKSGWRWGLIGVVRQDAGPCTLKRLSLIHI